MKKLTKAFLVLALLGAAVLFFAACEDSPVTPVFTPTYTVHVDDFSIAQGASVTVNPTITALAAGGTTTGITVAYVPKVASVITVSGNTFTAPTAANVRTETWTATARKGAVPVSAAYEFTITVVAAGTTTYQLNVPNLNVAQDASATAVPVVTANPSSAGTSGITVTYAVKTGTSTLTFSGDTVTAPEAAVLGPQIWTATAKKGADTVATHDFTITVVAKGTVTYTFSVAAINVTAGSTATVVPVLTASDNSSTATGFTYSYAVKTGTSALTFSGNTVSAPANATSATEVWTATAKKGAEEVATADFNITITGAITYVLTITGGTSVVQGGNTTVTYTLTADGAPVTDATVAIAASSDVPATLSISGLTITAASTVPVDSYDFTATATKDGATLTTKNFTVDVTAIETRSVLVTVTIGSDPAAALEDGEYVWIAGNFYTGTETWNSVLLTEQTDKTWTVTLNIPGSFSTFYYKLYAVKSTTENDWGVTNKVGEQLTATGLISGVFITTVVKWYGRSGDVDEDELFDDPGFTIMETGTWAIPGTSASPWKVEGATNLWVKGDGREGRRAVADGWRAKANQQLTFYQDIDLTDSGIGAGTVLTLSVYVFTGFTDLATKYDGGKLYLVCGSQTYAFEPQTGLDKNKWDQVLITTTDFTLASGDIVGGKLKAGLSYTPKVDFEPNDSDDDSQCTWAGDFSLKVKD